MKYCGEYQGSVRTTTSRVYVKKYSRASPNAHQDLRKHPLQSWCTFILLQTKCNSLLAEVHTV